MGGGNPIGSNPISDKLSNLGSGPLGGLTGTAGGIAGTGIQGPQMADIQKATGVGNVLEAQVGTGNSLQSQQALLQALQGQNGLGQQNAIGAQQQGLASQMAAANGVGNQSAAMQNQAGLNSQLASANGVGTQNSAIQGLQGTAGMYQNIAQGRGPNPAQAMLNQSTGQNVANQAALMAGQRGAGANVGLMARQAAQQGANTQQQAVGQGATMQANQQLNALQGLTGAQQAIGGLGSTQVGMQQAGIGQQGALAGQQIAQQQAQQQAMANQANAVAGQQIAGTSANTQANLSNQQQMQNALGATNNAVVSAQNNVNAANSGIANTSLQGQQKFVSGMTDKLMSGTIMGGGGAPAGAHGGRVIKMALGGDPAQSTGPTSSFGQFLTNSPAPSAAQDADPSLFQGKPPLEADKKKSSAPKLPGPAGDMMAGPDAAGGIGEAAPLLMMAAEGGLASTGGHVDAKKPSQKAVKSGDSYSNDKVPAMLSEGEIVLPRSVTQSEDPVMAAAEFVRSQKPVHKADGGEIDSEEEEDEPDSSPEAPATLAVPKTVPINPAEGKAAQAPVAAAAAPVEAQQAPVQAIENAAAPQAAPNKPISPTPTAEELNNHDMEYQQDLARGAIKPKTYQDILFKDKSTLGKIGTLFGLMMAGGGSGVTGQPMAILGMMDKEIERDLEAQKQTAANAQSFQKLRFDHNLQQAQIRRSEFENLYTAGQAGTLESQNKLRQSQANEIDAGIAGLKTLNEKKNGMLSSSYQYLQDANNKLPPAQQAQGQAYLQNVIAPAITKKIQENNATTAAKMGLIHQMGSQKEKENQNPQAVDIQKMQRLIDIGKSSPEMPGAIPPGDVGTVTEEAKLVQDNRAVAKMFDDSFKKLDKAALAGKLNKQFRAAEIGTLLANIARTTAGRYNQSEAEAQAKGLFPDVTDFGPARSEKYNKSMDYFKSQEAALPTLDRYGLKTPFPEYSFGKQKQNMAGKNANSVPIERKTADGRIVLYDPVSKKPLGYKETSNVAGK